MKNNKNSKDRAAPVDGIVDKGRRKAVGKLAYSAPSLIALGLVSDVQAQGLGAPPAPPCGGGGPPCPP